LDFALKKTLLAGLLMMNYGKALGRPPSAEPEFVIGRRAAAGREKMNSPTNYY
jgi:hypothetical protein